MNISRLLAKEGLSKEKLSDDYIVRREILQEYVKISLKKELIFAQLAKKLTEQEEHLERLYIEPSRTMYIAQVYLEWWPDILHYNNANPIVRLMFSSEVREAYVQVMKRLHCNYIPDIQEQLLSYMSLYQDVKTAKDQRDSAKLVRDHYIAEYVEIRDTNIR